MIDGGVWAAFVLLGLSICAVWLPAIRIGHSSTVPAWLPLFTAAALSAFVAGVLELPALAALATLAGLGAVATGRSGPLPSLLTVLAAIVALALALHVAPGFRNPVVIDAVRLSHDAALFTQYANFDKGAAGLLLLVFFCQRAGSVEQWRRLAAPTAVAAAVTAMVVLAVALAAGVVRTDPKLPAFALTFMALNLLFTCIAEEAFFRGLLQERLTRWLSSHAAWHWVPIVASSALFGAAHFAGGPVLMLLATLGGAGYALVYAATRRIEAAVLTHFAVNMTHFFGFTYPRLQA